MNRQLTNAADTGYPEAEIKRLQAENAALKKVLNEAMITSGRFHAACMECDISSTCAELPDPDTVARNLRTQTQNAADLQAQLLQERKTLATLRARPSVRMALWFDQILPMRIRWIRFLYEGVLTLFLRLITFRRHH